MKDIYLTIKHGTHVFPITRTSHIGESRYGKKKTRDNGIHKGGFELMLKEAFKHGLNQYKNSKVVITFNDHTDRRISVLLEHFGDSIELISAFRNWKNDDFKNNYITVQNRINLVQHWVLPKAGQDGNTEVKKVTNYIRPKAKHRNRIRFVDKKDSR